jgi:formylglycine-generating enzyme required for sulfatase activity
MRSLLFSLVMVPGILMLVAAMPALAEPRIALVIGNSNYGGDLGRLPNPVNDAELMSSTLRKLGFQVIKVTDADQRQMKRAIADFGTKLANAGSQAVGLFYYAGHGLQIDGENYIIPVHADIEKAADVDIEAVAASGVLKQMQLAENAVNIVILDACRNNPLSRGMRSATQGLARMDAPTGSILAYSTAPGETAADGNGKDSPYTVALAQAMLKPGIAIEETFRDARVEVLQQTDKQQVPWESSSLTGAFFFNPGEKLASIAAPAAPSVPSTPTAPPQPSALPTSHGNTPVSPGKVSKDCGNCPEMVSLPSGEFRMGSPANESGHTASEGPQIDVTVSAFEIGKYPVTRGEFNAFVKASGYAPAGKCWTDTGGGKFDFSSDATWKNPGFSQTDRDPVVCVSWQDADAYAHWLSKQSGKSYRLRSESEWEYAARAGTQTARSWSDSDRDFCSYGNIADRAAKRKYANWTIVNCDDGYAFTSPVGSFKPNGFGLTDMLGNAKQWTADCGGGDLSKTPTDGSPVGDSGCSDHAVRGSGWDGLPNTSRAAYREHSPADYAAFNYGFRVARDR